MNQDSKKSLAKGAVPEQSHNSSVTDPLGVIERCAREIFEQRGRPAGQKWEDFIGEAEQLLLAGRAEAPRAHKGFEQSAIQNVPPRLWALRDQDSDPFAAALAKSVVSLLSEHEAFCMGVFLASNEFQLSDGAFRRCSSAEISGILAEMAGEYERSFLQRFSAAEIDQIPLEARREHWAKKLSEWLAEDRPLNYADRNTIDRICNALRAQPVVTGIRLRPLGETDS